MTTVHRFSRRAFVQLGLTTGVALAVPPRAGGQPTVMPRRPIPATGEEIPVIGLGTSDEFDRMPADGGEGLKGVIRTLLEQGGTLIDTAPVYGNSESVLGQLLAESDLANDVFLSTKIMEYGAAAGLGSIGRSEERLGRRPLDLIMVPDLVDVQAQLRNLREAKDAGRVRYIGVTTSRVRRFPEMESLIESEALDFIQVNYSVTDTLAEERVIPAAVDHGVAVMINRPFGDGRYFRTVGGHDLPAWAAEFGCESWGQFSLKYILSNPDVTCVIPATSNPGHMLDNARAAFGPLPDTTTRRRQVDHLQRL